VQRAAALYQAGRLDEARAAALELLAADARHFNALHLLAAIGVRAGRPEEALDYATRALALVPGHPEVLCNRGIALRSLDRIEEALADYDRVLAANPAHVPALSLRGVALAALNRHGDAIDTFSRAIAFDPRYAPAYLNRAFSNLVTGRYDEGWRDFEWRWTGSDTQIPLRGFKQPGWRGEDLRGHSILVHAEQGLGDALQFSRYVPLLAERGAKVVLEVQAPLKALFAELPARLVTFGETLPATDFQCAMLSLPFHFGTRADSIPADIPYLRAPQSHVEKWQTRVGPPRGPRIGIAWSGNTRQRNDRNRSIPLGMIEALRAGPWTLVSLQKEIRDDERAALGGERPILHFGDELADFRDTAALVSLVDAVVSVDTSVAHLAGAMGTPLTLLLTYAADWRWLLDRADSPWYPTARLLRQRRRGDWLPLVNEAKAALVHTFGS
jgi:Flp pilus assembly protein TadD